jgi:integrase
MLFPAAATAYLNMRTMQGGRYIERNTEKNYRNYARSLGLFFGGLPLYKIHLGHIRQYQQARVTGSSPFIRSRRPHEAPAPCSTKPQHVNQELCMLRAIMRRAEAWTAELEENYEELIEQESEIPRALSPEEQQRWIDTARKQTRWHVAYCYSLIAFDTTMSTNEMRSLRLGDINLHHQTVNIPWSGSKNRYRHRSVPLESADCLWAMQQLLDRARGMGAHDPQHFLFPFVKGHVPDLRRPMTVQGLKKLWQEVREATGLMQFRMYDTRHTAITRMAEGGVPIAVIMAKAGHISPKMTQHYTQISAQMQRRWAKHMEDIKKMPTPDWTHEQRRAMA